jgi:hypothetical protein
MEKKQPDMQVSAYENLGFSPSLPQNNSENGGCSWLLLAVPTCK